MLYRPLFFLFFLILSSQNLWAAASKVLWVKMEGTVELGLSPYIVRALKQAESENFQLVVLEIDTFGGRVDAAVEIRDALLDSKVPTLAWINKRAISAGALISLACDKIYFSPGGSMGAATPIQGGAEGAEDVSKKYVSYFRTEMGATAEQKGWPKELAEAMVQAEKDIPGVISKGEVLSMSSETALKLKMATGLANSREHLLKELQLDNAELHNFEINWAERIVRFLTDPTISGLLMSGGVLGIILELQAPGFGLPGMIGIACFALFFFGKFLVYLAGWEEVLLLLLGVVFIVLEFFVLPGTFIFAVAGIVCVFLALFFAGISPKVPLDFSFPSVETHVISLAFALISLIVGLGILYWIFARFPNRSPLVLSTTLPHGSSQSEVAPVSRKNLVGKTGICITALSPSGKISIDSETYDAISITGFIERGQNVEVIEADEMKIQVAPKRGL